MESLRTNQVSRIDRRAALAGMAAAAFAPLGCFGIGKSHVKQETPQPATQGLLRSAWENKIVFAPDVSRGGAIIPGLSARVWLLTPEYRPRLADGELKMDLYDSTPRGGSTEPRMMEVYVIGRDILPLFARPDFIGDGYSIFFPWMSYQPDVKQVYIVMRFTEADGAVFMHQSGTFSLDHTEASERVKKGMAVTASTKQVSAK